MEDALQMIEQGQNNGEPSPFDRSTLVDQVWHDMSESVPRPIVAQTVTDLLSKYDDVVIQQFVPMLVRREARELLRVVDLTEVEAKFRIDDPQILWHLQTRTELAGYAMSSPRTKPVWDTYLDTSRRHILRAGFSCRERETRDGIEMTLKSLGRAEGAVHRRGEWSVMIPASRPPLEWPESQMRDRVLQIIEQEPLLPLLKLEQIRVIRQLQQAGKPVAELSMDSVTVGCGGETHIYHELEVELRPAISEEVLVSVVQALRKEWHLQPEPLSKFERALFLLEGNDG